jgi:hypothetical protein
MKKRVIMTKMVKTQQNSSLSKKSLTSKSDSIHSFLAPAIVRPSPRAYNLFGQFCDKS